MAGDMGRSLWNTPKACLSHSKFFGCWQVKDHLTQWIHLSYILTTKSLILHKRISKSVIEMVNTSISADRKLLEKHAQDFWVFPLQFYEFFGDSLWCMEWWNDIRSHLVRRHYFPYLLSLLFIFVNVWCFSVFFGAKTRAWFYDVTKLWAKSGEIWDKAIKCSFLGSSLTAEPLGERWQAVKDRSLWISW